jgi:ubiquinone/menaquinone biosynthesis C-methylase UbiE
MIGEMQYLPPVQQPQQGGGTDWRTKYQGKVADLYDDKRAGQAKWTVEQQVIENMLVDLPPGSWVLDAPCGSGRFLKYCLDHHLVYRGLDISEDMIRKASAKTDGRTPVLKFDTHDGRTEDVPQIAFTKADLLSSGIPDKSVDAALCIRITRGLSPEECQQMFKEMQRIARDRIILTARVCNHQFARPLALFEAVMSPEWRLERSECGASGPAEAPVEDPAYRIFLFKRKSAEVSQPKSDDAWVMDPYEAA